MLELNVIEQIKRAHDFIEEYYYNSLQENLRKGQKFLVVDYQDLCSFDPDMADELINNPEDMLVALEKSIEQFDLENSTGCKVRIKNLNPSNHYTIGEIRADILGKFVCLGGFLLRKSVVRPRVTSCRFECPDCGNIMNILQLETSFKEPTRCSCGRKGKFHLLDKELIDVQSLVVQEKQEELEGSAQPQRIDILLKEDLVAPLKEKKTNPGCIILINGIVKEVPVILRTGEISTTYNIMVEANYVEIIGESFEDIVITKEQEEKIKEVSKRDPLKLIMEATAPTIFGHEKLKEAVILQIFSGVRKILQDKREVRGDSHILIIGDPGVAKTALIKALTKLTPKWQYVSGGGGASGVGIAAAVVKDDFFKGGFTLDAGAGVLAHNGMLFFDELDKMRSEERSALHEIMESQCFTVHKAGINATLMARATVLAAANPKYGRFDPNAELFTQLELPPTLINRFDLVFALTDRPNETTDDKMARHILKSHRKKLELDKLSPNNPFFDMKFAKEYIAFAKTNIFPELTDEAEELIHNYYTNLRKQGNPEEESRAMAVPINARYLEGIVRIGEQAAKVRLSADVTKEDAKRAIDIVDYCLRQFGYDPAKGWIDIDRISGVAVSASKREKFSIVLEIIKNCERTEIVDDSDNPAKGVPINDILSICKLKGITLEDAESIIDKLKLGGDIYEPRAGFIQTIH